MRELKFRAWDKKEKILRDVREINFEGIDFSVREVKYGNTRIRYDQLDRIVLLQYTGLNDKNGIEIYEGDILFEPHEEEYPQVIFDEGVFYLRYSTFVHPLFEECDSLEIVGNIYENPELLEE